MSSGIFPSDVDGEHSVTARLDNLQLRAEDIMNELCDLEDYIAGDAQIEALEKAETTAEQLSREIGRITEAT